MSSVFCFLSTLTGVSSKEMSLETKTHNISCFPPKNHDGNFVPLEIEFFKGNCSQLKLPCPRDSVVGLAIDSNELKLRTKRRQSGHDTPLGTIQVARLLHFSPFEKVSTSERGECGFKCTADFSF